MASIAGSPSQRPAPTTGLCLYRVPLESCHRVQQVREVLITRRDTIAEGYLQDSVYFLQSPRPKSDYPFHEQ